MQFFEVNWQNLHCFLLLSNILCCLQQQKTLHKFICYTFFKQLNPDPHSEKLLDPDPQKMNVDPQPWFLYTCSCSCPLRQLKSVGIFLDIFIRLRVMGNQNNYIFHTFFTIDYLFFKVCWPQQFVECAPLENINYVLTLQAEVQS